MALIATTAADREIRKNLVQEIVKVQREFSERSQKAKSIKNKIKKIRIQSELQSASAVAYSPDISHKEYEQLSVKRSLTESERNQIDKYILRKRYGVEVTPQLKRRDDRKYYSQLLLHYYLTDESEYFRLRDFQEWNQQLYRGDGKVFLPDIKIYTLKVEALLALGIPQFLEPDREFRETDIDLIRLRETTLRCSKQIKRATGVTFSIETESDRLTSIKILSQFLSLLGLKLKRFKLKNDANSNPDIVYKIAPQTFHDGRQEIFEVWHERDTLILETASNKRFNLLAHIPPLQLAELVLS